jgi:hypothetical protein
MLAAWSLLRRYERQRRPVQHPQRPPRDRIATLALALAMPCAPVALLLANVAAARLRSSPDVWGNRLAITARWIATVVLTLPIGGLIVLSFAP